jgi:hypothetical protein
MFKTLLLFTTVAFSSLSWATDLQPDRNDDIYNLNSQNVGMVDANTGDIYDPVAVYPEAGGEPMLGNPGITASHGNVTYYFANEANRDLFLQDPVKYEPTYGGWCAFAMANQAFAQINPRYFTLHGNRAHYFISRGAKARFDRNLENMEADADDFWKSESGEQPRL